MRRNAIKAIAIIVFLASLAAFQLSRGFQQNSDLHCEYVADIDFNPRLLCK